MRDNMHRSRQRPARVEVMFMNRIMVQHINIRNLDDAVTELVRTGAPAGWMETAAARGVFFCLRVSGVAREKIAAVTHSMLASGGYATSPESGDVSEILLFGTVDQYGCAVEALEKRGEEFVDCAAALKTAILRATAAPPPMEWNGHSFIWGARTYVMGILNVTPDSFYAGSRRTGADDALETARAMIDAGADILDVGGESTRPGAEAVPEEEELSRVVPAINALREAFPQAVISIDTYKAAVARAAFEAGADFLNDISAMRLDPDLARAAADAQAPVCLMHMQGTPRNMQMDPHYEKDVIGEIIEFLDERIAASVDAGISEQNIIVDPGIGFGKTVEHNLEIVNRLGEFRSLGRPVLLGASRKSFIGKTLELDDEADRLEGSLAVAALGVAAGADILRVHDVAETVRVARMADAVARKKRALER